MANSSEAEGKLNQVDVVESTSDCPLPWPTQRRNLILFALCTGMQYFAAPVLYVGITQASLCDLLQSSTRTANLPATLFFSMTAVPALIAWASPRVASLRRNLALCYGITGITLLALAAILALPVSNAVKIGFVILQGGVSGAAIPTAIGLLWEAIRRGSDESKRGLALSMAFGAGPVLAVLGSFLQTYLIGGVWFGIEFPESKDLSGYVLLFAVAGPVMLLAAIFSTAFAVPVVKTEACRQPIADVLGLVFGVPAMFLSVMILQLQGQDASWVVPLIGYGFGAMSTVALIHHFRPILSQRVLLLATLVTVLVYCGNTIPSNMNLYTQEALGELPKLQAGMQNTLRFGFKVVAGFVLGWMLMRTSPRAGILATSTLFLLAQVWAIVFTGKWYLVAFGIYGAGELVGVYAPNYIASASRTSDLRRNMAFSTMLMVPAAPVGYLFGSIVDIAQREQWNWLGMSPKTLGFRLSFATCACFILSSIVAAIMLLPAHPGSKRENSDLKD